MVGGFHRTFVQSYIFRFIYILHLYISGMSETTTMFVFCGPGLHDRRIPINFPVNPFGFSTLFILPNVAIMTALYVSWPVHIASIVVFHSSILGIHEMLAISLALPDEGRNLTQVGLL